jgi:hypothetical protein
MKVSIYLILTFFPCSIFGQANDFILLKKNNKTVATYFSGEQIQFTTQTGAFIDATITQIKKDTIFLKENIVRQIPTNLGVYVLDTVSSYRYQYHYNQIKAIGKTGRRFNISASSGTLIGGGLLLSVASGVVYLVDKEKYSPQLMIAGLSGIALGYLLTKITGKGMIIGKRYSLVYINAIDNFKK